MNIGLKTRFRPFEQFSQTNQHVFKMDGSSRYHWCRFRIEKHLSCCLVLPLDVHSGNVARKLGLLTRKQNDGKALTELDLQLGSSNLRIL
jgi:hypothetical protein